jgi:biopolymer transport protein ExbD
MKPWLQEFVDEEVGMQIAPLIDMVFLLLIYFLVTSSLKPQEADIEITLPGIPQTSNEELPDEQIIVIDAQDRIDYNGITYDDPNKHELPGLVSTLLEFRQMYPNQPDKVSVTIDADDDSTHQRTIDVMNACAAAGVKNVSFTMGEE